MIILYSRRHKCKPYHNLMLLPMKQNNILFLHIRMLYQGSDHVQVNWKYKSIGYIGSLETRPLIRLTL